MRKSQLRAARAALGWSQEHLAEASGVSLPTIKRLEPGFGVLKIRLDTLEKLQAALEGAGVEFLRDNGNGFGIRVKEIGRGALKVKRISIPEDVSRRIDD